MPFATPAMPFENPLKLHSSRQLRSNISSTSPTERRPKFPRDEVGFHTELRSRVRQYFTETGYSERDCWQMYLKTAIILAWLAAAYVGLVFFVSNIWVGLLLGAVLGMAMGAVGFSIQHDGGHHAYSRYEWINYLAATSLDLIGASSYLWRWKHGVFHHTYSNVAGQDTDIEAGAVARLSPHQPRRAFHRWQHLYLWPLYGLTASRWHLYGDFKDIMAGTIGPHKIPRPKGWDLVVMLLGKFFSVGLVLGLPLIWHPWWLVIGFYLFITCVVGVVLTVVFQLAHCVEEADFPIPDEDTLRMESAWAVHQVETTVDFARDSRTLCWLLGGLNFQIEHHLFPRICHIHYPALSKIVEEVCGRYGVRYANHGSFMAGVVSHYRWLKRMGSASPAGATN